MRDCQQGLPAGIASPEESTARAVSACNLTPCLQSHILSVSNLLSQETLVAFAMSAAAGLAVRRSSAVGAPWVLDSRDEHAEDGALRLQGGQDQAPDGGGELRGGVRGFLFQWDDGKDQKWERHVVLKRIKPDEDSAQEMQVGLAAAT